jgi:hypothetical protein
MLCAGLNIVGASGCGVDLGDVETAESGFTRFAIDYSPTAVNVRRTRLPNGGIFARHGIEI